MDTAFFNKNAPEVMEGLAVDIARRTPRTLFSVPVGAGGVTHIRQVFGKCGNFVPVYFTDYLDGFSQAANPKRQDHYHSTSAGIIYKFGTRDKGISCPVVNF